MAESEHVIAAFRERGRVPSWAWQRLAREHLAEGRRFEVRASALDPEGPAEQRAAFLRELGGPHDAAMVEALRDLLGHERPWIVYFALEGLAAVAEPTVDEEVRALHGDGRRVCDLWFEDRISHMAARAVRPDAEWLGSRRGELQGKDRFMAPPDDPFGEVEALRAELGVASRA